jgi:hypothetical protein
LAIGDSEALVATVSPLNATDKSLTWTSSNDAVAGVNPVTGVVTAKTLGIATITATSVESPGISGSCEVEVLSEIAVRSVLLTRQAISMVPGDSETIGATVLPANATNKDVKWSSSNTNVAEVSQSGLVTAVGAGVATIRGISLSDPDKFDSCLVSVQSIYVAGTELSGNVSVAKYWRNEIAFSLGEGSKNSDAKSIAVSQSNVAYVAGNELNYSNISVAKVWINGVATNLSDGVAHAEANCVYLSNIDYYVAGYETIGGKKVPTVRKNGANPTRLAVNGGGEGVANSMVFTGGYDYVVGHETNNQGITVAMYWKGGVSQYLTDGGQHASANSVFVAPSGDVWVAGWVNNDAGKPVATLWKNGSKADILSTSQSGAANSIFMSPNGELLVAGYESNGIVPVATVWKGTASLAAMRLGNGGGESNANGVCTFSQDVYVAGFENIGTPAAPKARMWKNGYAQDVGTGSVAKGIAIR